MTEPISGSSCFLNLLYGICIIPMLLIECFVVWVAGPDLGRVCNGNGGLEWVFAYKRAVGRDTIRTVLFVISDSSVHKNPLIIFFVRLV